MNTWPQSGIKKSALKRKRGCHLSAGYTGSQNSLKKIIDMIKLRVAKRKKCVLCLKGLEGIDMCKHKED